MNRKIGPETAKSFDQKQQSGFFSKYFGANALEIGHDGGKGCETIFPHVIGVDIDYPGYDGVHLPFADQSQDTVYASHVYEHVTDWKTTLQEWHRVLKVGGHMIICVPHVWLYEKKPDLPSRYNRDHKRFYAPFNLLEEVWHALPHLSYRIRHMCDNDQDWNDGWIIKQVVVDGDTTDGVTHNDGRNAKTISAGEMHHSGGCYEIELVLEKTTPPAWANIAFGNRKILGRG